MTTSISYTLADDPAPLPATTPAATSDVVPNAAPLTVARGLLLPFQRNQRSDFASGTGAELWITRVELLLSIKGPSERGPGELPWRPRDGSALHILRHKNNTPMLREMARAYVTDAFRRSLPGVRLTDIVIQRREGGVLHVRVKFDVLQGNTPVQRGLEANGQIALAEGGA